MPIATFRKRVAVAGINTAYNTGALSETIPDAFYRASIGNSYLSLAAPPGGTGGDSDQTVLGGLRYRTDDNTPLGG